jgi:hypothetical protein
MNMRKILTFVLLAGGLVFLSGNTECQYNQYDIEMTPGGQELTRTLTCTRQGSEGDQEVPRSFDPAELDRIAGLYAERLTKKDESQHTFRDKFLLSTPQDVGGSGRYLRVDSLMGSSAAYAERFRGDDDQAGQLQRSLQGVDQLVDIFKGWFSTELKTHPGLARLLGFCDKRLRKDLHNLVVYAALLERMVEFEKRMPEEIGMRVVLYLVERGYLDASRVSEYASAMFRAEVNEKAGGVMSLLQRLVARELGLGEKDPVPGALGFLADFDKAASSLSAYLRTTPEFKKRLKAWQDRKDITAEKDEPKPMKILEDILLKEIFRFEFGTDDKLNVRLNLPVKPFATNGTWDDKTRQVQWLDRPIQGQTKLPTFLYAIWSQPERKFQNKHFGKMVLSGEGLAQYVAWRSGLTPAEGKEWDDFLKTLRPAPADKILERLTAFRFSTDPKKEGEEESPSLAETPLRLISTGLAVEVPTAEKKP